MLSKLVGLAQRVSYWRDTRSHRRLVRAGFPAHVAGLKTLWVEERRAGSFAHVRVGCFFPDLWAHIELVEKSVSGVGKWDFGFNGSCGTRGLRPSAEQLSALFEQQGLSVFNAYLEADRICSMISARYEDPAHRPAHE